MADDAAPQLTEVDYRLMIDSIVDTEVVMLDPDGVVVTWNEGARRIMGYEPDEIIGKHVSMFFTEEDQLAGRWKTELELSMRKGRFEAEAWRTRKDGSRFWANVVIQPMYMHGSSNPTDLKGFVKITRDLTEQQEQEGELRLAGLMLDSISDYEVVLLDVDGTIKTWNRGAQSLKGYSASEVVGKNVSMFYSTEEIESGLVKQELDEALRVGRYESEGWRTRKDGSRFRANFMLSPARDVDGNHVGYVKVTRDITERVERENLVQRQRDEILELSTPVIQIWEHILVLPIIGTLDSLRAARLTESLLQRIASDEAAIVILDISGVPMIDTAVAQHLFKTIQGARLMGAESIISGVRPETAQAMVHLGIDIGIIRSRSTLRDALQLAFAVLKERAATLDLTTSNATERRAEAWSSERMTP